MAWPVPANRTYSPDCTFTAVTSDNVTLGIASLTNSSLVSTTPSVTLIDAPEGGTNFSLSICCYGQSMCGTSAPLLVPADCATVAGLPSAPPPTKPPFTPYPPNPHMPPLLSPPPPHPPVSTICTPFNAALAGSLVLWASEWQSGRSPSDTLLNTTFCQIVGM